MNEAGKRGEGDYRKRRPLGLAPWKPQARTLPVIEAIDRVLDEYRPFWPLTARQAEALPPDVLARIVREAVESEVDHDAIAEAEAEQEAERTAILALLDSIDGVAS